VSMGGMRLQIVMAGPFGSRADALAALLGVMSGHLGGIEVFPLWPAAGKPASRVIVRGQRDSKAPLTLRPGLVLHGTDGRFTPRAESLLREGAALRFDQPG
ncbi:MAG: methyltransferase, partial [Parvibaculum sp.]